MKFLGLLLALLSGLFFIVGFFIANKAANKEKLSRFSISLALVVMLNLIIFDLIPEVVEIFAVKLFNRSFIIAVSFVLLGIILLKVLDKFIPDHHHDHKEKNDNHHEHNSHIYHIGIVTLFSLLLHNIIEGIAIYGLTLTSFESGLFMCIGVALHNIPLGISIAVSLSKLKEKTWSNKVLLTVLSLSSLLGALTVSLFGTISETFLGIIASLTLGMIIYIAVCELLPEIINNRKHKEVYYGIITGVMIIVLSLLF